MRTPLADLPAVQQLLLLTIHQVEEDESDADVLVRRGRLHWGDLLAERLDMNRRSVGWHIGQLVRTGNLVELDRPFVERLSQAYEAYVSDDPALD